MLPYPICWFCCNKVSELEVPECEFVVVFLVTYGGAVVSTLSTQLEEPGTEPALHNSKQAQYIVINTHLDAYSLLTYSLHRAQAGLLTFYQIRSRTPVFW